MFDTNLMSHIYVVRVTPHKEVLEYIKYKASDYEGWIDGMQNLQEKFIDEINDVIK